MSRRWRDATGFEARDVKLLDMQGPPGMQRANWRTYKTGGDLPQKTMIHAPALVFSCSVPSPAAAAIAFSFPSGPLPACAPARCPGWPPSCRAGGAAARGDAGRASGRRRRGAAGTALPVALDESPPAAKATGRAWRMPSAGHRRLRTRPAQPVEQRAEMSVAQMEAATRRCAGESRRTGWRWPRRSGWRATTRPRSRPTQRR